MNTRCTATRKDGQPCQAWAVADTSPPRCAAHGGGKRPPGAPAGNKNRQTHGFYSRQLTPPPQTIAEVAQALADSLARLQSYITANIDDLDVTDIARLIALEGMHLSRLARVLKQQADMSGGPDQDLQDDIDEALRLAGETLGVPLQ